MYEAIPCMPIPGIFWLIIFSLALRQIIVFNISGNSVKDGFDYQLKILFKNPTNTAGRLCICMTLLHI